VHVVVVLASALLTSFGCASHVPVPPVGSVYGSDFRGGMGTVETDDEVWRLVQTTSPSISWGGEGPSGYHLVRQDSAGRVVAVVDLGKRNNDRIGNPAFGYGAVWLGRTKASVIKVDASTNTVAGVIRVANGSWWRGNENIPKVAVGEGAVWVVVAEH